MKEVNDDEEVNEKEEEVEEIKEEVEETGCTVVFNVPVGMFLFEFLDVLENDGIPTPLLSVGHKGQAKLTYASVVDADLARRRNEDVFSTAAKLMLTDVYSGDFDYELDENDIEVIKDAMIIDGISVNDEYFKEPGLFGSKPALSNTMYVMRERNVIPIKTHKVCLKIHKKCIERQLH